MRCFLHSISFWVDTDSVVLMKVMVERVMDWQLVIGADGHDDEEMHGDYEREHWTHVIPVSFFSEGLHWLCHQRQATDALHARERAVLPVPDVEVCGVTSVWVLHYDHDCPEHRGAHDEGWYSPSQSPKNIVGYNYGLEFFLVWSRGQEKLLLTQCWCFRRYSSYLLIKFLVLSHTLFLTLTLSHSLTHPAPVPWSSRLLRGHVEALQHRLHCPLLSGMHSEDHCLRSAGGFIILPVYLHAINMAKVINDLILIEFMHCMPWVCEWYSIPLVPELPEGCLERVWLCDRAGKYNWHRGHRNQCKLRIQQSTQCASSTFLYIQYNTW